MRDLTKPSEPDTAVLLLSRLVGGDVLAPDGSAVGRLADLLVRLAAPHPVVHRLLVRSGRHTAYLLPWTQVTYLGPDGLRLSAVPTGTTVDPTRLALEDDELLLARDVLDTEVIDLEGRRLSRVSDVMLLRRPDGRLEIAAVDVGTAALLRRIGLPHAVARTAAVGVDWAGLHLTSSRGHVVQLRTEEAGFRHLDTSGLAHLVARLSTDQATDVLRSVEPARASAALHESHPVTGERLMLALTPEEAQLLIETAEVSHAERLRRLRRHAGAVRRRPRFRRTAGWRVRRPSTHRSGRGSGTAGRPDGGTW